MENPVQEPCARLLRKSPLKESCTKKKILSVRVIWYRPTLKKIVGVEKLNQILCNNRHSALNKATNVDVFKVMKHSMQKAYTENGIKAVKLYILKEKL